MDSANIIKLTTKMHMKITLLGIVAHISIPTYIMHSKWKFIKPDWTQQVLFAKSLNQIDEHTKPCVTNSFSII